MPKKQALSFDNIKSFDLNKKDLFITPPTPGLSSNCFPQTPLLPQNQTYSPLLPNNISETTHSKPHSKVDFSFKEHHPFSSMSTFTTDTINLKSPGLSLSEEKGYEYDYKRDKSVQQLEIMKNDDRIIRIRGLKDTIIELKTLEDAVSPVKSKYSKKHEKNGLNKEYKILFDITEDFPIVKFEDDKNFNYLGNENEEVEEFNLFNNIFPTNKPVFFRPSPLQNQTAFNEKTPFRINPFNLNELFFENLFFSQIFFN